MAASAATAANQSVAVEDRMHGADRRGLQVVMQPAQLLADLRRTPGRVLAPEPDDERLDLQGQLVGMPLRPAAAVGQANDAAVLVALVDLVAGVARDIELAAERRHLLPPRRRATNRSRSSILEHSRQGTLRSAKRRTVTYVTPV